MKARNPYPLEFKLEAVKLVTDQGMTPRQVARDLGIDPHILRRWLHELGRGPERPTSSPSATAAAELARLRRENEHLRQEPDSLKKARGIFSRMPQ